MGFLPKKQAKKHKKPIIPTNILINKVPTYLGNPNVDGRYISWRFSNSDKDGPFCCNNFEYNDYKTLLDRLRSFELMNYAQFRDAKSFHSVPTANISKRAKERLQQIQLDDIDILYSFHITGPCRLWCMKHDNILSVLWWDRNHEVYPIKKRRT